MQPLLHAIARFVTRRRGPALAFIAVLTVATGVWLPTLVTDPTPQQLTASGVENQAEISAAFNRRFGNPDHVVLLLVQAEDVLAPDALAYVHRLATSFREQDYVERVEGITVTPLPVPVAEEGEGAGTLEDLGGETLEDLGGDTLEDLDEEPAVDPAIEEALGTLVRVGGPERFSMGLMTIADRVGAIRYGPAVEGETVTEAERQGLLRALENAPLVEGRLISRDRTVTAVALFLDPSVSGADAMQRTVRAIDAWLAANPPPPGVRVDPAGLPHLFNSIATKIQEDNVRLVPLTLMVCLILLFLSFRWIPGTVLPLLAVGISVLVTIGGMALFGQPLNVINNIIAPLLIIVGVSDSIHLIARYREELGHASSKLEAAERTVRAMALACFLTSATTAVGLGSLVVSRTAMLRDFGIIAAIGVMIAYVVTIVFLPAAMTLFKPPLPPQNRPGHAASALARGWLEKGLVGLTTRVLRRPWLWLAVATLWGAAAGWSAVGVRIDSALLDEFEQDDTAFTTTVLMEQKLDGVRPLEVMLTAREPGRFQDPQVLREIADVQAWLEEQPGVLSTLSASDYLHESWARLTGDPAAAEEPFRSREQVEALSLLFDRADPNPLERVLSDDGKVARIQVRLADVGSRASIEIIEALRARLTHKMRPFGIAVAMTGEAYTGSIGLDAIVSDLLGSLGTAVLIIFGMMVVLFRSWRLGLLAIPPNVIPLIGTMAWMSWRQIPLNAATVIVFSISLGLAVDASIHILARYREETGKRAPRSVAILRAGRSTGRGITVSCATLMLGFGVMLLSSFIPVRRFGELTAVTVGLSLVSTLIVQPALLRVLAPKVPPNRFRRAKGVEPASARAVEG